MSKQPAVHQACLPMHKGADDGWHMKVILAYYYDAGTGYGDTADIKKCKKSKMWYDALDGSWERGFVKEKKKGRTKEYETMQTQ